MSDIPKEPVSRQVDVGGDQSEVITFLSDPSSYSPPVPNVERIETHGALVFLAGDYAYKLKRAVKLPYLDFSTIAKRESVCRHEIERNQEVALDLYICARPIVRLPTGELAIGCTGEPIDWVVVMNRFDQADLFDNLAQQGRLPVELMAPLAEQIATYHERAQPYRALDGNEVLAKVVTQTIMSFFEAGDPLELSQVHEYAGRIVAELNTQSQLLRARSRHGYLRLCHGDLHLRNIVLRNGQPILFDAIEFDDNLAKIDVLYDLAFLLMDLWHRDLTTHANHCFNTYVSKAVPTEGLNGLAAVPAFLAIRAAIRAMVAIDKAAVVDENQQCAARKEIADYFTLARQFLKAEEAVLVAIGGFSGTGKTTLAAALSPKIGRAPGALHLRSDVERKRMVGVDPLERLPRHAYSEGASAKVYKRLCDRAEQALGAGQSVIVDATFLEAYHRRQIERIAARSHVRFSGLWLEASQDCLVDRVTHRRNDASDADAAVVLGQLAKKSTIKCWETFDTSEDFESVLSRVSFALRTTAYRRP